MDFHEQLERVVRALGLSSQEEADLRASWVFQNEGLINMYSENHLGTQPIRVTHNMLLHMFSNTYPSFPEKLQALVDQGKLNPTIHVTFEEESIRSDGRSNTPFVNQQTRQINLHESFLSYLWCISYSVYILYVEKVDYPKVNKEAGEELYSISQEEITKADELFGYARSLIAYYSPWEKKQMPNPELYLAQHRDYVEQTNLCYTAAAIFILAHELTHIEKHIDQLDADTPESNYLRFEEEADQDAILHTIRIHDQLGPVAVNTGIVTGLLSMLYFSYNTTGERHPNVEDRITAALETLDINSNDPAWGMACVGLELWERQFSLNFDWLKDPDSSRTQYYYLIDQVKTRTSK